MDIIKKIKQKKEFSDLPDEVVSQVLQSYFSSNPSAQKLSHNKYQNIIIKSVRAQLRKFTGQYQSKSFNKKLKLLEQNKILELLKTHSSTKERLPFYNKIKKLISSYSPSSILDLGCGLNPIALNPSQSTFYYCYDIKSSDLKLIKHFFKTKKIKHKTYHKDITKVNKFPKTDLCLIFKTLDIIDNSSHSISTSILKKINSPIIIASFSTKTLSGKPMNSPKRHWFEKILKELNYSYKTLKFPNEIFYLIKKP